MLSNVTAFPGNTVPSDEPDYRIVNMLEDLLAHAKSGRLRCFIGTGYMSDGCRISVWADHHDNVYEMLGSFAWLQAEYLHKHTEAKA